MQNPLGAIGVFPAGGGVVMYLIGARNDAIHSVAAEGTDVLGARIEPPVHQIKVMTILVHEAASAFAAVLNPVTTFWLEGAAEFLAPGHVRRTNGAAVDQKFNLREIRRVAKLMAQSSARDCSSA